MKKLPTLGIVLFVAHCLLMAVAQRPIQRPSPPFFQLFQPANSINTRGMNTPCQPSNGSKRNGTCVTSEQCRQKNGNEAGACGSSNQGVCCLERHACGKAGAITTNSSVFANPENPDSMNASQACIVTVNRIINDNNICQIRLDFEEFELAPPNRGRCDTDQFSILGVAGTNFMCGSNSGQHMYVDFPTGVNTISLQVVTTGFDFERKWRIRVSQIECNSPSIAPSGCLQYYTGTSGNFRSFNYEATYKPGYQKELNYGVCIRRESGFCGIRYTNIGNFQVGLPDDQLGHYAVHKTPYISPATLKDEEVADVEEDSPQYDDIHVRKRRQALVGGGPTEACPSDFLLIPNAFEEGRSIGNNKFCGNKFNPEPGIQTDAIVSSRIMPFVSYFFSDTNSNNKGGRGFFIHWQQTPCTS